MPIDPAQVEHIAALARIALTDAEKEAFARQLSDILDQFEVLQALDTTGVEPTAHVAGLDTVLRDDEPAGQPGRRGYPAQRPPPSRRLLPGAAPSWRNSAVSELPTASELWQLSVAEASRLLADREISSVDLTDACLERIAADGRANIRLRPPSPPTSPVSRPLTPTAVSPPIIGKAARHRPSPAFPCRSRTCSAPTASPPPAPPGCSPNTSPCTMPPPSPRLREPGAVLLGKGNMDELRHGFLHRETPSSSPRATPGTPGAFPVAAAAAPRRRWRPAPLPSPWAPIPAAASASPPPSAE